MSRVAAACVLGVVVGGCGQVATQPPDAASIDAMPAPIDAAGCDDDEVACEGTCIDPDVDNQHCGATGTCEGDDAGDACTGDTTCVAGECSYSPVGPQFGVEEAAITGWNLCHQDTYGDAGTPIADLLATCGGDDLLIGCRPTGATALSVLAWAPRGDVLTDTGYEDTTTTHAANGTAWYYNDNWSWGFAAEGDVVDKNSCDYGTLGAQRMCWHTYQGTLDGGYRCGDSVDLYDPTERLIFTRYRD
jgi:hypothetical protein